MDANNLIMVGVTNSNCPLLSGIADPTLHMDEFPHPLESLETPRKYPLGKERVRCMKVFLNWAPPKDILFKKLRRSEGRKRMNAGRGPFRFLE